MKPKSKFWLALLAWGAMNTLGATSWWLATLATAGGFSPAMEQAAKVAANTLDIFATPGWLAARASGLGTRGVLSAMLAHALSWGLIVGVVMGAIAWTRRPPVATAKSSDSADSCVGTEPPTALSRRRFLRRSLVATPLGLGAAGAVYASGIEPSSLRLRRYDVHFSELPLPLDGLRIALLTDTHLGRRVPSDHIRRAVRMALDLNPDVFVLGGDYVDHAPDNIAPSIALFAPLVATGKPILGVLGNHDYYADAARTLAAMRHEGIVPLLNDRRFLTAQRRLTAEAPSGGLAVCIAGIDDLWEGKPDIDAALRGVPRSMPRVMISHNPDIAESCDASTPRIDLMLSGHTHGGQVAIPFFGPPIVPSRYGRKYARGLVHGPRFPVIVSTGVGTAIAPVRLGVPPEVVEITLRRVNT